VANSLVALILVANLYTLSPALLLNNIKTLPEKLGADNMYLCLIMWNILWKSCQVSLKIAFNKVQL